MSAMKRANRPLQHCPPTSVLLAATKSVREVLPPYGEVSQVMANIWMATAMAWRVNHILTRPKISILTMVFEA